MTFKENAEHTFSTVESDLIEISHWMYHNPEIRYQEVETSARLATFLSGHGFEVSHPAYGLDTAFEANLGSSGPRVVICCEYDALPEVGQACGHNIIATAGMGAGIALAPLVDQLGIRLTVLGTPAEEGGGGKVELLNAGAFEGAAAAMMIHPSPADMLDPSFQARETYTVEFFGKESHAAFAPWLGLNALDGFVQAYVNVATLRQHILPTDRIHCIIDHGGDASNVIPAYTKSTWNIRSGTNERLQELVPRVIACFEAASTATGCRVEVTAEDHPYLNVIHNPTLSGLYAANSAALGRRMPTEAEVGGGGGSTDMGNVSQVVPSIHPMIGIDSLPAVNHQKEFAAHTITPTGDRAIRDGALAMAHTVIDLAEQNLWDQL